MTTPSNRDVDADRSVVDGGRDRDPSVGALDRLAKASAAAAAVAGLGGALYMLGAFGPVSCATSTSSTSAGTRTTAESCTAGIDYLFGAGGNAPVLFFWSATLVALVGVGAASAWTDRTWATWLTTVLCGAVTVVGVFGIGWFFLLPTLALLAAALARTVAARRDRPASR